MTAAKVSAHKVTGVTDTQSREAIGNDGKTGNCQVKSELVHIITT
ncbi:hypothetical protein PFLA_b0765 [Pseudoalteromonas flavipulchra NCIMB 2033 = ATCC BAA-314]|nr:hypothetical protein [Pseudoalteromonas flavipulchra NCIMB 2033 = ATCC BAA-314]